MPLTNILTYNQSVEMSVLCHFSIAVMIYPSKFQSRIGLVSVLKLVTVCSMYLLYLFYCTDSLLLLQSQLEGIKLVSSVS